MTNDSIFEHFMTTNALLKGHFILSSGLHSSKYLQCALALQRPEDADQFGKQLADKFKDVHIDTVVSPAIGGLIIGLAVARALGVRFIWTERENGKMTLRRGFSVREGEKILVVEDVITTGGSTRECMSALTASGASIVGAAAIIDRSNRAADVGVPMESLAVLDVKSYKPEECPLCAAGEIAYKPGSRT
jgi:orotate phosphoribosyltransferase